MAPKKKSEDSAEKKAKQATYEHYVRAVPELPNFEEIYHLEHHLIKSYDELMDFYNNQFNPDSFFAWDTETTDLNPERGKTSK